MTSIQGKTFKNEEKGCFYARSYFDRRIDPHINILCVSCGKIEDLDEIALKYLLQKLNNLGNWELIQQTVYLQGTCKNCKENT